MSEKNEQQAVPTKCKQCSKPMSTPVVCDYCHAVNPTAATLTDHFTLLGLPRQFDIDPEVLHRKYLELNRHAHPDFHAGDSPDVQELHLRVSAAVNDAYRTLKDSASRAGYLLELLGGRSSADDKTVPDGFLETMMMMQEEIAESNATEADRRRIGVVLRTQHDGLMCRIATLFDECRQAVACEAVRTDLLGEIRKQLNAVSYVKKLLSQL